MKNIILAAAIVVASSFALTGCFAEQTRASTERDMALYGAQVAALQAKKPTFELVGVPGEPIVLSGVSSLTVWGDEGGESQIQQRVSPFWGFVNQNSGILGMLGLSYLLMPNGVADAFKVVEPTQMPTQVIRPEIVNPIIVTP